MESVILVVLLILFKSLLSVLVCFLFFGFARTCLNVSNGIVTDIGRLI